MKITSCFWNNNKEWHNDKGCHQVWYGCILVSRRNCITTADSVICRLFNCSSLSHLICTQTHPNWER